jgi:flagellar hook-associated protein 3 FlgL
MRVNPNFLPNILDALTRTQAQEQTSLLQMATGLRVNKPSDDPAAAATLLLNRSETTRVNSIFHNLSNLSGQLQTADAALNSVTLSLQRAITLGVEAANGTLSAADRASVASEIQGIEKQVLGAANTTFNGQFLFAGTATQTPPFVSDATMPSGVRYDGNSGVNSMQAGENLSLQTNQPGSAIFTSAGVDVFQELNGLVSAIQSNSGIETAVSSLRSSFDYVSAQRVFYGNAMQQISEQTTWLNQVSLQLATQQNAVGGADLAKTTSDLVTAETARSATMQAASRVTGTSLFDYLK